MTVTTLNKEISLAYCMKVALRLWIQRELANKSIETLAHELNVSREKIMIWQLELAITISEQDFWNIMRYQQKHTRIEKRVASREMIPAFKAHSNC